MSAPNSQSTGGTVKVITSALEWLDRDVSRPPVSPTPSPPMDPCTGQLLDPQQNRNQIATDSNPRRRPSRRQWAAKSQTWTETPSHAGHGGDGRTGDAGRAHGEPWALSRIGRQLVGVEVP